MREKIYEIIEVAKGENKLSKFYDYTMIIIIISSIIPLCFKTSNLLFVFIDRITVSVFIIDYICRWVTADYKLKRSSIKSFLAYPFTPFAIIDLLSILPSLISLNTGFKLLRLLRLNRIFRVLRILRYSKSFNLMLNVIKKEKYALLAVSYMAIGFTFISALVVFTSEPESFENFFDAIYWSVVTLTTVGYGDIYPISNMGRIFGMISSFLGIAIVALPTGVVTAGYMKELEKKENNINDVEQEKL